MDKHLKTNGIILRRINLNEADQILSVLTEDFGKMSFFAKGSRRTKSKFCGHLELLKQIKITAFRGENLNYLNESESECGKSLYDTNLKTKGILFYTAELTNKLMQDNQHIEEIYPLLLNTLDCISLNEEKGELLLYSYIIKILGILGFMAPWDQCIRSGEKINLKEPLYLSLHDGNIVRGGYNSPSDPRLTPSLIKWVNFMQKADLKDIMKVVPTKGERVQVWYMIKIMLGNILSSPVKSEEFMGMVC